MLHGLPRREEQPADTIDAKREMYMFIWMQEKQTSSEVLQYPPLWAVRRKTKKSKGFGVISPDIPLTPSILQQQQQEKQQSSCVIAPQQGNNAANKTIHDTGPSPCGNSASIPGLSREASNSRRVRRRVSGEQQKPISDPAIILGI